MAGTVNSWNNQINGSYNQIILNAGTNGVAISTDAAAATLSIGTGGAVKAVTVGSTNTTSSTIVQSGSGNVAINTGLTIDSTGRNYNTKQPAFSAYKSSASANVTGDATQYTVICDTTLFNQGSNYNTVTGLFTAPIAGNYQFNGSVYWTSIGAGYINMYFLKNATLYAMYLMNNGAAISGQINLNMSFLLPLAANDTVGVAIVGAGTTKTMGVNGGAGGGGTFFSGFLVC